MSTNDPRYGSQPGAQGPEGMQWSQPVPSPEQPMQPPTGQPSSQPAVPTNPYAVPQPGWAQPSQVSSASAQQAPAPGSAQQVPLPGQQPYAQGQQPHAQGRPMGVVPPVGAAPAKKSNTGLIVGILIAVAVVFIGGLVALGFVVNSIMKAVETTTDPFTSNPPTTSPSTTDPSTALPSTKIPLDQTASVGDWEVHVDGYTPDATADVAAAYVGNEPAGTGNVYTMVHLTVTYRGTNGANGNYLSMDLDLVSESGTTRGWFEGSTSVLGPDDIFARGTVISPGQSVTGNIVYEVPRDETFTALRVSDETGQFVDIPLQ